MASSIHGKRLTNEIAAIYGGHGDARATIEAFRAGRLLVPCQRDDTLLSADYRGIRWIYAFTSEIELARYANTQHDGDRAWRYVTVSGVRLLNDVVPQVPGPAGVAVDVAGQRPMFFPPVRGIVPDEVAVDVSAETAEEVS